LISSAISQNKSIGFTYRSKKDDTPGERKIDPYLIVFFRDHWNVIGFSHKREAVRNFVLDRMSDIHILEEKFVPYGQIDTEGLIFRSEERSHKIEVDVYESALRRFEANLPAKIINKYQIKPNLFRIKFIFDNLNFINEWLLQFPREVIIIGPDLLLDKRNKLLDEMMDK